VPEVTIFFWIVKIMATTVGETGADFLIFSRQLGLGLTLVASCLACVACLLFQMRAGRYTPLRYWLTVVVISIMGTLLTDGLVDKVEVSLPVTTIFFAAALALALLVWKAEEETLSIRSIVSTRREAYYWLVILLTFALGTAAGDLLAESWQLGYALSAALFAGALGLVFLARQVFGLDDTAAFWIAYILTRPFGASCGDYLAQPVAAGGIGLGATGTSLFFLTIIVGLVGYMTLVERNRARMFRAGGMNGR
jgi:uncharacterized membrane-anchored protein